MGGVDRHATSLDGWKWVLEPALLDQGLDTKSNQTVALPCENLGVPWYRPATIVSMECGDPGWVRRSG
jgi:hypothetical protein